MLFSLISQIFLVFLTIIIVLLILAYALYADRKIWAAVQKRRGPNVVGPFGLLQSFADFFKFAFKELIFPANSSKVLFLLAPLISFVLAISLWAVIPIAQGFVWADLNVGLLYLFAISSLSVYGVLIGGWSSHSSYAFLGALRSAAQMISYEVSIGFIFISVVLCSGSFNITSIVLAQQKDFWFALPLFPLFIVFIIVSLAETHRPPFDLPEAESELVAGYMVEYSSTPYLLFMIAEFSHVLLMCALGTLLFLGGWLPPIDLFPFNVVPGVIWFLLKCCAFFFLFSLIKAVVPRYRYDQLMILGWKVLLPITFFYTMLVAGFLVTYRG